MRYHFLLDENVLYHAARLVDEHDRPDETAAELVRAIARICHRLTIHRVLFDKYWDILQKLLRDRSSAGQAIFFINVFMKNVDKRTLDYSDLPELPAGVRIPRKDEPIVRAALISHPMVVTADRPLREAIRRQPVLRLTVYSPKTALEFVQQHPVEE